MSVTMLGHLHHTHQYKEQHYHRTNKHVWLYQYAEVVVLHQFKLRHREQFAGLRIHGVHTSLHKMHRHKHAHQCTKGVECLSQIKALRGSIFTTHAIDIGVATGFKKRQSTSHHEIGQQKGRIHTYCLGRQKE